jgi:hypothetical protein
LGYIARPYLKKKKKKERKKRKQKWQNLQLDWRWGRRETETTKDDLWKSCDLNSMPWTLFPHNLTSTIFSCLPKWRAKMLNLFTVLITTVVRCVLCLHTPYVCFPYCGNILAKIACLKSLWVSVFPNRMWVLQNQGQKYLSQYSVSDT